MRKSVCPLLTAILLLAPMSIALAEVRPGAVTLSAVGGVYGFEGKQNLETKPVYGLRLGYDFVRHFGVEAVGDWVSTFTDNIRPRENHVDVYRYGLDGLIYLAPDWRLVPYLAVGGGGITIKDPGSPWDKNRGYFNYGLGVKVSLVEAVSLRADFRHILFSDKQTMNNYEGTLGLAVVFGGKKPAAAAPAPIAAPVAPPPPPPPPVGSLKATPESVDKGKCATLTWYVSNATGISIEPGIGSVPSSGSRQVCPDNTTRYTITATGEGGSGRQSTTVTVKLPPPPPPAPVVSLSASPESIDKGQCATLTWSASDATGASIEPGIGSVPQSGSRQVCPDNTTRYAITATGESGSAMVSTTVTVKPPPPPPAPVVSLSASPESIDKGRCAMLSWSATNAIRVSIEPGIGSVAPSGNIQVCLDDTKRYTLTAIGEGGSGTASATVTVKPPPKMTLRIEFDTNKTDIQQKYIADLAEVADFLKKNPGIKAVIEGHTDDVGKPKANIRLSLARAERVKNYLVKNFGIEASRLSTAGYGSARPIADNSTDAGRRQNRRIEAVFM